MMIKENIIDEMPFLGEDVDIENKNFNESFEMPSNLSNEDFVVSLYKNILHDDVDKNTPGFKKWSEDLNNQRISL